jgi:hypothetical protein
MNEDDRRYLYDWAGIAAGFALGIYCASLNDGAREWAFLVGVALAIGRPWLRGGSGPRTP